ncbi:MAG: hypothetical protein AB7O97_07470 [Planctomycetota bacterium]
MSRTGRVWWILLVLTLVVVAVARKSGSASVPVQDFGGAVRDRDGEPMAGMEVEFHAAGRAPDVTLRIERVTTDGDGRFSVRLPVAPVKASVLERPLVGGEFAHFDLPALVADAAAAGSANIALDLEVLRAAEWPTIRGVVVDGQGRPIAGATVSGQFSDSGASADDGTFVLQRMARHGRQGTFRLQARHRDHDSATAWAAWGDQDVRVELGARVPVEVTVTDGAGSPLAVEAVVVRGDTAALQAFEPGVFRGALCREPCSLAVELGPELEAAGRIAPLLTPVDVPAARAGVPTLRVQIVVPKVLALQVRVEDEGGAPIAGAEVDLVAGGAELRPDSRVAADEGQLRAGVPCRLDSATTTADGLVALRGPSGSDLTVRVQAPGFRSALRHRVDATRGTDAGPVVVRLSPRARVRVLLHTFARSSEPVDLFLETEGGDLRAGQSAARGSRIRDTFDFVFDAAEPGTAWLSVRSASFSERWPEPVELRPGPNPDVVLDATSWRPVTVHGRITRDGEPVARWVCLRRASGPERDAPAGYAYGASDDAGAFAFEVLPGSYVVDAPASDPIRWEHEHLAGAAIRVGDDAEQQVTLAFVTGQVELHLVDPVGAPARGESLWLLAGPIDALWFPHRADGDGVLRARLSEGTWNVVWQDPDARDHPEGVHAWLRSARRRLATVEVRAGETTVLTLELPDKAFPR